MALRFVNQGEDIALKALVNHTAPQDLVLRLFTNDVDAGKTAAQKEAMTESDFQEATFTGYSAITLTGSSWNASPGDPSVVTYSQQTFTSTADQTAQTIYGYYYTQVTSGKLIAYEYFASPVTIQNNGDTIKITPRIEAKDTVD
jgi:hypothetical protein